MLPALRGSGGSGTAQNIIVRLYCGTPGTPGMPGTFPAVAGGLCVAGGLFTGGVPACVAGGLFTGGVPACVAGGLFTGGVPPAGPAIGAPPTGVVLPTAARAAPIMDASPPPVLIASPKLLKRITD